MSISLGVPKRIGEHKIYNFGLALPFIAAFYVLNKADLPYDLGHFGNQVSICMDVLFVLIFYSAFLWLFIFSSGIHWLLQESMWWMLSPALFLILSLLNFYEHSGVNGINSLMIVSSLLYVIFGFIKKGSIVRYMLASLGGFLSLLCFVSGVLWFSGNYIFESAIAWFFGFHSINVDSYPIVSYMLISSGYVLFYALFEVSDLWFDK